MIAPLTEDEVLQRITVDPAIFGGKPIIRGLRISVEHVLGMLAAGDTPEKLLAELKYVERKFNEMEQRSILKYGDILMTLVGASIGRTAIYDLTDGANINQAVALIRLVRQSSDLDSKYLLHVLNSPFAIDLMLSSHVTTAQPNISLTDVKNFSIPLPPLAEQKRIVAKVDELMALVDQLEEQLTHSRALAEKLLEALVAELTSAGAPEPTQSALN